MYTVNRLTKNVRLEADHQKAMSYPQYVLLVFLLNVIPFATEAAVLDAVAE